MIFFYFVDSLDRMQSITCENALFFWLVQVNSEPHKHLPMTFIAKLQTVFLELRKEFL